MTSNAHHIGKKEKVSCRVLHTIMIWKPPRYGDTGQTADDYFGAGVEATCRHSRLGCWIDVTVSLCSYFYIVTLI